MNDHETAQRCAETMLARDVSTPALGIRIDVTQAGNASASMRVRDDMVNGHGVCHGGLVFTLADTAFAFACNTYDRVTVAAGATIEFVRPARAGDELVATAHEVHRGRRSGYYDVRVVNQHDELVALFRGRSVARDEPILGT